MTTDADHFFTGFLLGLLFCILAAVGLTGCAWDVAPPAPENKCVVDPCERTACRTTPGQAWIPDYKTCTCECAIR